MGESASASVHVASISWTHAWRAPALLRRSRRALRQVDGVSFAVVGRSSAGRGHRDISRSVTMLRVVVLVEWDSPQSCAAGVPRLATALRDVADEVWTATLVPIRSHGTWRGHPRFEGRGAATGPVAALTYARVRTPSLFRFYVRGFPASARQATDGDSSMLAGIGFGDVPIRHACTVSFWPSAGALDAFAYGAGGPHDDVQRRATDGDWLAESLFARFVVSDRSGTWAGRDPLAAADLSPG